MQNVHFFSTLLPKRNITSMGHLTRNVNFWCWKLPRPKSSIHARTFQLKDNLVVMDSHFNINQSIIYRGNQGVLLAWVRWVRLDPAIFRNRFSNPPIGEKILSMRFYTKVSSFPCLKKFSSSSIEIPSGAPEIYKIVIYLIITNLNISKKEAS